MASYSQNGSELKLHNVVQVFRSMKYPWSQKLRFIEIASSYSALILSAERIKLLRKTLRGRPVSVN